VLFASLLALVMLAAVSSWRCSEPWSVRRLRGRSLLAGVVVVLSIGSPMTAAAAATSTVDTSKIAAHVAQYAYDTAAAEHQLASPDPQELPGPVMSAATRRRPPQSEAGADVSTTTCRRRGGQRRRQQRSTSMRPGRIRGWRRTGRREFSRRTAPFELRRVLRNPTVRDQRGSPELVFDRHWHVGCCTPLPMSRAQHPHSQLCIVDLAPSVTSLPNRFLPSPW
jgi:hypothetical protein